MGPKFGGPKTAMALFAVGNAVVYGHIVVRTLKLAEVGRRWAGLLLIGSYLKAILFLMPAAGLYWLADAKITALVALAAACAIHVGLVYRRHPRIGESLKRLITRDKSPAASRKET